MRPEVCTCRNRGVQEEVLSSQNFPGPRKTRDSKSGAPSIIPPSSESISGKSFRLSYRADLLGVRRIQSFRLLREPQFGREHESGIPRRSRQDEPRWAKPHRMPIQRWKKLSFFTVVGLTRMPGNHIEPLSWINTRPRGHQFRSNTLRGDSQGPCSGE